LILCGFDVYFTTFAFKIQHVNSGNNADFFHCAEKISSSKSFSIELQNSESYGSSPQFFQKQISQKFLQRFFIKLKISAKSKILDFSSPYFEKFQFTNNITFLVHIFKKFALLF
jgi:hypothetical protein